LNRVDSPHTTFEAGVPAEEGDLILERRRRLSFALCPPRGGCYLDFGCGNGAQTLLFLPSFTRCIGVDINDASLERFRAAAAQAGVTDRLQLLSAQRFPLELPDGCVDYLSSFEVLEHVQDEAETLREWHRLLSAEGRLVVSVPNRWWIFEMHGATLPLLPWNRVPFFGWLPKNLHDRWARARNYTCAGIEATLRAGGFAPERSVYVTAPMDVLRWRAAQRFLRSTVFRGDQSSLPFLATSILLVARKE
jgi:SAM-dependent methyltransferase